MEGEVWMLVVETITKIRSAFFKQGKAIKAIWRELGVSRKVVREGEPLRSDRVSLRAGKAASAEGRPLRDTLDQLLSENETRSSRERLTLIRVFEELHGLGYEGGRDAVRRYARRWAKE
jgi:hypothetical protein